MGFIRLIFASVFTEIYVRKLRNLDQKLHKKRTVTVKVDVQIVEEFTVYYGHEQKDFR